jgi:TolA-binding protein
MEKISLSYSIERYIAGEMSDSEKEWFEEKVKEDKNLRNEVNVRQRTDEILENRNIQSLRNKLSAIEKRRDDRSYSLLPQIPSYLKYAAVFLGILFLGSTSLFFASRLNGNQVVAHYYKAYEPASSQRSGRCIPNDDFMVALNLYNTHEYGKAAVLFSKVVESNPEDMQSELLNGLSNFEDKKYPEAKNSFVNVIDNNNNFFVETAKWYLALCYVKTDEKEKAIQLFENIGKENGIYRKDAKNIIRRYK